MDHSKQHNADYLNTTTADTSMLFNTQQTITNTPTAVKNQQPTFQLLAPCDSHLQLLHQWCSQLLRFVFVFITKTDTKCGEEAIARLGPEQVSEMGMCKPALALMSPHVPCGFVSSLCFMSILQWRRIFRLIHTILRILLPNYKSFSFKTTCVTLVMSSVESTSSQGTRKKSQCTGVIFIQTQYFQSSQCSDISYNQLRYFCYDFWDCGLGTRAQPTLTNTAASTCSCSGQHAAISRPIFIIQLLGGPRPACPSSPVVHKQYYQHHSTQQQKYVGLGCSLGKTLVHFAGHSRWYSYGARASCHKFCMQALKQYTRFFSFQL